MKKFSFVTLLLICCVYLYAQQTHTIEFNKEDYSFTIENGILSVSPSKTGKDVFFSEDTDTPAFPYSPLCILRPAGYSSEAFQVEMEKELIYDNISIEAAPMSFTTREPIPDTKIRKATKDVNQPVIYGGDLFLRGYCYVYLKVSPFVYDATAKKLFFVSRMTITLPDTATKQICKDERELLPFDIEEIKKMVINPEDLEIFYPQAKTLKEEIKQRTVSDPIDYLIVTSNALKDSFEVYAKWKMLKGIRTRVITVEDICQNNPTQISTELKIKNALYDYYLNHGLKWVLLGGDTTIVPSLMCRIKTKDPYGDLVDGTTPTDLFYACFGGTFNWDWNSNGIYGEIADNISLYPNIYVSRLPFQETIEVHNYLEKEKRYENSNDSFNKLLQVAKNIDYSGNGNSNFANESTSMFQNYIYMKNCWMLFRDYLYDNSSNISGYDSTTVNNTIGLLNSDVYHFIDINSHGYRDSWALQRSSPYYFDDSDAIDLTNQKPFVVTTAACRTNGFDDNCLSRAMLGGQNGCVSYYGSSRDGWASSGGVKYSCEYIGKFYECLFTNQPSSGKRRFAAVVAEAKSYYINEASSNENNNKYRWLQFSMNPMGDPELQIHNYLGTTIFGSVSSEGNSIKVETGYTDSCTIALVSTDGGVSYFSVVHDVSSYTFENVNCPVIATITKDNCIPYQSKVLYTLPPIEGNTVLCSSGTYSVNQTVPSNYLIHWSLEDSNPNVVIYNPNTNQCTVSNTLDVPIETNLIATLSSYPYTSVVKKSIITHPAFSVTCSQSSGSYGNNNYPESGSVLQNSSQGFVVNPCCEITLTSPNFKHMQTSCSGVTPTSYTYNGDNQAKFVFPYQATPYTVYYNGVGDSDCNDFSIKMTVSPTPIPFLDMRTNWTGTTLNVVMGFFDPQDSTSMSPVTMHNHWDLWIYKADSSTVIYSGYVSGLVSLDTSSWGHGYYVVRGLADGHGFAKTFQY
jgi:hypothetical protein